MTGQRAYSIHVSVLHARPFTFFALKFNIMNFIEYIELCLPTSVHTVSSQSTMDLECEFENLPNFRQAGGRQLMNRHGQKVRDGLLYRSSRTDFLTEEERETFERLKIKTIIDLRRTKEYKEAEGEKILDEAYPAFVVKKGRVEEMRTPLQQGDGLRARGGATRRSSDSTDDGIPVFRGKRYLINMMTMDLIWYIFGQVNFFIRYLSLVLVLIDWLCGCKLFVKFFAWAVVNRLSLAQQYVNLLEYSKPAVVDILRLIVDGDNVPVLIHCAHGKDRTGLIIALILECLGVEDDVIAEDYAKSEVSLLQQVTFMFT